MLRHLERRLGGRPLSSMFDLIVGTSTGAIQAVSLGLLRYTLDQCEGTYTDLGHKIFNNQVNKLKNYGVGRNQVDTVGYSYVHMPRLKARHAKSLIGISSSARV